MFEIGVAGIMVQIRRESKQHDQPNQCRHDPRSSEHRGARARFHLFLRRSLFSAHIMCDPPSWFDTNGVGGWWALDLMDDFDDQFV
jgi:hypothetical protein